jgi:hypothetical protein
MDKRFIDILFCHLEYNNKIDLIFFKKEYDKEAQLLMKQIGLKTISGYEIPISDEIDMLENENEYIQEFTGYAVLNKDFINLVPYFFED